MTSLPSPPKISSLAPRPRILSSPSRPARLSFLSVPKSRPPLGQPGRSFVVKCSPHFLKVLVPWHRASSSDTVACDELPCSFFLELSELVPAQPTTRRRTAHPIRKVLITAMKRPWRTTAHPPSLGMCPLLLAPRSMPHNGPWRISTQAYSPECVEYEFSEVRGLGILRTSPKRSSRKLRPLV